MPIDKNRKLKFNNYKKWQIKKIQKSLISVLTKQEVLKAGNFLTFHFKTKHKIKW